MFCTHCGARIDDGAKRCASCGKPVGRRRVLGVVGAVLAAVLVVAAALGGIAANMALNGQDRSQGGSADAPREASSAWADECTDEHGNPTMYDCLELEGRQVEQYLQEQGYSWTGAGWVKDGLLWTVVGGEGESMDDDGIGELGAGAVGVPAAYTYRIGGYADAKAALKGNAQVAVEDSLFTDTGAMAVVRGSDKREAIAVLSVADDGLTTVVVYNEEAVESGLFDANSGGGKHGKSIGKIWKKLTGHAPGAEN